ncbi:MAG: molybdopterin-dependent oxidoreductase [Marinilabiliales bacterium]|nr:molybdopterin-dependent oxidoreductase [Marinilabiliales bacterium]
MTSNIVTHHKLRHGRPRAALRELRTGPRGGVQHAGDRARLHGTRSGGLRARADGVVEVYGSMQRPFSTRRFVAALLGEPLSNVEVYTISVGGGFGGKDDNAAAVMCPRRAGRQADRPRRSSCATTASGRFRETYKRHPYRLRYRVGVSSEGKVLAVKVTMHADSGAYLSVTPWVTWRSTAQCFGPYADGQHPRRRLRRGDEQRLHRGDARLRRSARSTSPSSS